MTKSSTTPIVMLTLQDLRDVIREEMGSSVNVTHVESNVDNVRSLMRKGVLEYCILCILAKREAYAFLISAIIQLR